MKWLSSFSSTSGQGVSSHTFRGMIKIDNFFLDFAHLASAYILVFIYVDWTGVVDIVCEEKVGRWDWLSTIHWLAEPV